MAPSWKSGPDVVSQRLGDEVVSLNLRSNRIFSLNRTGARAWELLQTGHDWRAIRSVLLEEFDVQPEELDRELETLAASLAAEGLAPERGTGPRRSATSRTAVGRRRASRGGPRRMGRFATLSLLVRMGVWSLVLPVLKQLVPLPTLVRVMSRQARGARSAEVEMQIVRSARRVYRLRRSGSCLERSLLAYRYLSDANADPRLVIGVRKADPDVIGHAWVLIDGAPLFESSASLEPFSPVVEFASGGYAATRANGPAASPQPFPPS